MEQLGRAAIFRKDERLAERALALCETRELARGETLVTQGQLGSSLFVLVRGQVRAVVNGEEAHLFEAPARFGERTLFRQDEACGASCVVASETCSVLELKPERLLEAGREVWPAVAVGGATLLGLPYGGEDGGVTSFMGIRYGRAGRLEAPTLCRPSAGTLARVIPGPSALQVDTMSGMMMAAAPPESLPQDLAFLPTETRDGTVLGPDRIPQSDDCLQLNVTAPTATLGKAEAKVPVMVWIHGGAFLHGTGSSPIYDARELAGRGVVVVSINYRLGAIGFALCDGAPPNRGLLDQVCALEWVQEHIGGFGGDPENVTVFGESAGAMSIGCLVGSPLRTAKRERALFGKAILQSGATANVHRESQAAGTAASLAEFIGVAPGALRARLAEMRLDQVLRATQKVLVASASRADLRGNAMAFQPVVTTGAAEDAVFRGVHPQAGLARGAARDVKVLTGVTKKEFALFLLGGGGGAGSLVRKGEAGGREAVVEEVSARVQELLENATQFSAVTEAATRAGRIAQTLVPQRLDKAGMRHVVERMQSQWIFEVPCWRMAEVQSGFTDVFVYRLDIRSPIPGLGACHAIDLPILFGSWRKPALQAFSGADDAVAAASRAMQAAWVAFARSGNPSTAAHVWPRYDAKDRKSVVFGEDGAVSLTSLPDETTWQLWRGIQHASAL